MCILVDLPVLPCRLSIALNANTEAVIKCLVELDSRIGKITNAVYAKLCLLLVCERRLID